MPEHTDSGSFRCVPAFHALRGNFTQLGAIVICLPQKRTIVFLKQRDIVFLKIVHAPLVFLVELVAQKIYNIFLHNNLFLFDVQCKQLVFLITHGRIGNVFVPIFACKSFYDRIERLY